MALPGGRFDLNALGRAVEEAREDQGLTWSALSAQVGVSPSTIKRFASAADAEADGVLALIGWLGSRPEQFVPTSTVVGVHLDDPKDGQIRVDMAALVALDAGSGSTKLGTRTTIQRLVAGAQDAGVSIASLTRWSPG